MDITVRLAKACEKELLTDLALRSKRSNGYNDLFMAACREELTVTDERMKAGEYWVADAGVICGCVCLACVPEDDVKMPKTKAGRCAEIHAFFIDPNWQGKGIGRLLWAKILEQASQLSLARLTLDADPAAVSFYEKLGFEIIGESPSGSIPGRTIPRMSLSLKPYE